MIRRWWRAARAALGFDRPLDRCDVCDRLTKKPVVVRVVFDEDEGGGSAMVAKFCHTHAPQEAKQ